MKNSLLLSLAFATIVLFASCLPRGSNTSYDLVQYSTYDSVPLCNQKFYGTKNYIKELPKDICIPDGYAISDFVRTSDFDRDGVPDFLFVQYRKWRDAWIDGDSIYWDFYSKKPNGIFQKKYSLSNLSPPYLNDTSLEYLAGSELARRIFENYPFSIADSKLSFFVTGGTLRLSYKFDDAKGKSFFFNYSSDKDNWYLGRIEYFLGELPIWWWREDDFYSPLRDSLIVLRDILPVDRVAINEFSLVEAFKHRSIETEYLSTCYTGKIDSNMKLSYKKIDRVDFGKCDEVLQLPHTWKY